MDHEAEEVLNELNLLTEREADGGGQGDEYPVGELSRVYVFCVEITKSRKAEYDADSPGDGAVSSTHTWRICFGLQ